MQQITKTKKYPNGVQVFWSDAGYDRNDFFSFEDLVDQKINAFGFTEQSTDLRGECGRS